MGGQVVYEVDIYISESPHAGLEKGVFMSIIMRIRMRRKMRLRMRMTMTMQ